MKRTLAISVILLFLANVIIFTIYFYNNNKVTEIINEPTNNQVEESKIEKNDFRYLTIYKETGIIKDKQNNYIIYNPSETYSKQTLEELEINKMLENEGL